MERIHSFAPIAQKDCKVLILGSMPSVASLEQKEYYGNQRNRFWPLMFDLLAEEATENYAKKKAMLKKHRIALWDACASCIRKGSMDKDIVDDIPNDIPGFLGEHTAIQKIVFNGSAAKQIFEKHFKRSYQPSCCLPPAQSPGRISGIITI